MSAFKVTTGGSDSNTVLWTDTFSNARSACSRTPGSWVEQLRDVEGDGGEYPVVVLQNGADFDDVADVAEDRAEDRATP